MLVPQAHKAAEMYVTSADPYELTNVAHDAQHAALHQKLSARLQVLSNCSEATCH